MPANEPRDDGRHPDGADRGEPPDPIAEAEEMRGQLQVALALTTHRDPPTPALLITPDDEEYTMNHHYGSPDPPRTLAGRLERLNDNLQTLGERLKASIAGVVGDAIADAVRDAVRGLLGSKEAPADPYRDHRDYRAPAYYRDGEDDPLGEEDRGWEDEVVPPARETSPTREGAGRRWRNAVSAAVQAALWFLRQQPRPVPY